MIDYFALALIHGLLALVVLRLLGRDDLDADPEGEPGESTGVRHAGRRGGRRGERDA